MIVILEGPDGAGKTTLANEFVQRGLVYQHEGVPPAGITPQGLLVHYGQKVQLAFTHKTNVVFDRLAMGELIYGPVMRGESILNPDHWLSFERLCRARSAVHIVCLPVWDVVRSNWLKRKGAEYIKDVERLHTVYERYQNIGNLCENDLFWFDYEKDVLGAFEEALALKEVLPPQFIGSPSARYLFVGDQGGDLSSPLDLPFFGGTDSVKYLNRALAMAEFEEKDIAFVNARRLTGHIEEIPRLNALGQPWKIIALGGIAADVCANQSLEYDGVSHPQYWRRFHYHKLDVYAGVLKGCM